MVEKWIDGRVDLLRITVVDLCLNRHDLLLASLCHNVLLLLLGSLGFFFGFLSSCNHVQINLLPFRPLVLHVVIQDGSSKFLLNDQPFLCLGAWSPEKTRLKLNNGNFPISRAGKQYVAIETPAEICNARLKEVHHDH